MYVIPLLIIPELSFRDIKFPSIVQVKGSIQLGLVNTFDGKLICK